MVADANEMTLAGLTQVRQSRMERA